MMHLKHPKLNRLTLGQKHKFKKILIFVPGPLIVTGLVNDALK